MSEAGISETVSENPQRRPRGRPRRFSHEQMQALEIAHLSMGDRRTPRTLQNFEYLARAMAIIEPAIPAVPALRWLLDPVGIMQGDGHMRQTIMQALGRIESDAVLLAVVRRLCEVKPTARQAVAMIRRVRQVQKPVDLTDALRRTLNTYLREHPELTLQQAQEAVADLWRLIGTQMES